MSTTKRYEPFHPWDAYPTRAESPEELMPKALKCGPDTARYTVLVVNGDPYDSHSGRSFEEALGLALPDRGARVDVWRTCASDGGLARLPEHYKRHGVLVRSFRSKRGG